MINFVNVNDVNVVKSGEQKKKVLFKIKGEKVQNKIEKRMPLNISLAIDVSSSMNDGVVGRIKKEQNTDRNLSSPMDFLKGLQNSFSNGKTKMTQVKEAALQCVDLLEEGDYISLVTFNYKSEVILESTKITEANKSYIKSKIKSISAAGGTNLHDGWLASGMEVAKHLSSQNINRILVLTDGETNQGIQDPVEIAKAVEGLAKRGISTSTFGVGDQYNEDLLEKMATVSGGNSYYIEDENKAINILMEEFNCLNNIVADNAMLEFIAGDGVTTSCLNELDYSDKKYMIGNLIGGREVIALFDFSLNNNASLGEKYNLGIMRLSYVNKNGNVEKKDIELAFITVTEETFAQEKIAEEVNIQATIFEIAKQQKIAKEEIKKGNRDFAYELLNNTVVAAQGFAYDKKVMGEINQINSLMAAKEEMSDMQMSKSLSSMSYSTRQSRK